MSSAAKKPGLAVVVEMARKAKGDQDEPDGDEPKGDEEEGGAEQYDAAVGELFDALKEGDEDAFKSAFKAAVMTCK